MKTCPACGMVFPDESTFCFLSGDTLQPSADPLIGTSLDGRFRLERVMAETPWSKVYEARHRLLTEPCIVKIFVGLDSDEQRSQLHDAVAMARRTTHPHVVELSGGGVTADGTAFVVHPRRDARPLSALLASGPMPPARALGLATQMLEGLSRIHDFGAIHGGMRPSNVLVSPSGHVQLVDVGVGGALVRDPWDDDPRYFFAQQYQAPELNTGQRCSNAADLFGLGVVVFQMLSGGLPVEADDVRELRQALGDEPDIAGVLSSTPPSIVEWLTRLMARVPTYRPDTAHQALVELRDACESANITVEAGPGPPPEPARAPELDPGFARWSRFSSLFGKMIELGFPGGAPDQTRNSYGMIQGRVEQLEELGKKALYEHSTLGDVLKRAREGRADIARQMDELNDGAEGVRMEVQPLRIAAQRHAERGAEYPATVQELHREVMRWEGRSAFAEPYLELAAAYRSLADVMEKWHGIRAAQITCEEQSADKEETLREVETKLDELREALRIHEANLAAEVASCEQTLAKLGREADQLEFELLDLASRFSAPLRSKPELGGCFRELTQVT